MTEEQHKKPMSDLEFIEHSLSRVVQADMDYAVAPSDYKVDMPNQMRRVLKELHSEGMKASQAAAFLKRLAHAFGRDLTACCRASL